MDEASDKEKFYCLVEFPYPSGAGLHMGHPRSYTALDVLARKRRMEGYNVLYPIGWDAFGLPTENYAIKTGRKPQDVTEENVNTFRRQLQSLGLSFDWSREVNTTDPAYYKWTQWMFLEFFKAGMAYKKAMAINWCVSCKIGLANEEVVNGVCERCGGTVEKRDKEQWMIAITRYADRLIDDLSSVDYLPKIVKQQVDWIGRSEGAEVIFELEGNVSEYQFLGLHAFKDNASSAFWPWLQKELLLRGGELTVLDLPNPSEPQIAEQVQFIKEHYTFNKKTIVITHSLGGVAALKLLPELDQPIEKLILIAPPAAPDGFLDQKPRPALDACCDWSFDYQVIADKAGSIVVVADAQDHIVPLSQPKQLAEQLQAEFVVLKSQNPHFDGGEEPVVLQMIVPQITVFTTRPDTLFGATYVVLAPEHPLIAKLAHQISNIQDVEAYQKQTVGKTDIERGDETQEKTGIVLEGVHVIHPVTGKLLPVWVADYVLMGYGTGAIMAVPAHDVRDYQFAKTYGLPIHQVIEAPIVSVPSGIVHQTAGQLTEPIVIDVACYTGEGVCVNSDFLNGLEIEAAKAKMIEWLEKEGKGVRKINYRLRDWVFSRQRYWGEPIPLVRCAGTCGSATNGWVAVPVDQLPIELPEVDKYEPADSGESPLATITDWVNTTCPDCGGPATRETDTMPNWAGSSWYFLRYIDAHNTEVFADPQKLKTWMPVNWYNGGMEHTTLHLLYSRFWNKFLFDRGHVPTAEPYAKRTSHGLILAEDGTKMSKAKGNVVNPDGLVEEFGADALRLLELFIGPFAEPAPYSHAGIVGTRRFLEKVFSLVEKVTDTSSPEVVRALHQLIQKVGEDIEEMKYNTCVSSLMAFVNTALAGTISKTDAKTYIQVLNVFAPHVAEEAWEMLGETTLVYLSKWPVFDANLAKVAMIILGVQVNGKVRGEVELAMDATSEQARAAAEANEHVAKYLQGQMVKKFIYVPGRIVSFVV